LTSSRSALRRNKTSLSLSPASLHLTSLYRVFEIKQCTVKHPSPAVCLLHWVVASRMRIPLYVAQLLLVGSARSQASEMAAEQRREQMSSSVEVVCTPAASEDGLKLDLGDVVFITCVSTWYE
jgi:hypothetical protein